MIQRAKKLHKMNSWQHLINNSFYAVLMKLQKNYEAKRNLMARNKKCSMLETTLVVV